MFEQVAVAPPDPILGLNEAFNQDKHPGKINLTTGVYKDALGATPVLPSVKEAERRILAAEKDKAYKPISGDPKYGQLVQDLLFGAGSEIVKSGRAVTAHCPGGTGALRVASDTVAKLHGPKTVWVSDPTWANHHQIFEASGHSIKTYPYFDKATNGLALEKMIAGIGQIPGGDVILLHACCHNPSGVDPTTAQWAQIAQAASQRGLLPVVDFAYQGFGTGLEEDAAGFRQLAAQFKEMLVCSSFSKNFGLYNERVGALTLVAGTKEQADAVFSQIKVVIRANYSNPPAHGSSIVVTILSDPALRRQWEGEVAEMRERINRMRVMFVDALKRKGVRGDYEFIKRQRGMFSFSGLSKEQVEKLRAEFGLYIVGSGRINVAGMTEGNIPAIVEALATVL
jgi:aspartate/tyrosine/aromatic aminotransferase